MKCFTYDESERWLASMGVRIDGNRNLLFPNEQEKIMTNMPKGASALKRLSADLAHWFACDSSCMVWFSNWDTEPRHPLVLFEKMRMGCGEPRHIIDAPGHLFEELTEEENALLTGVIFLIMVFNWEGYIVCQNRHEFIYLGDEHIVISSADSEKMREILGTVTSFKLKVITDIRQAWTSE
ncbi:MAG: hypothetical protein JWR19_577 [Pedosphaera sp.]|nr:hypothetical protein [Pedosphaera sp.]